jgi:hypothetical protein
MAPPSSSRARRKSANELKRFPAGARQLCKPSADNDNTRPPEKLPLAMLRLRRDERVKQPLPETIA